MAKRRYALITFDLDDTLWDVGPVLARAEQRVEQWMRTHCPGVPERFDRVALMELRRQLHRERPELRHRIGALRLEAMRLALVACGHDEAAARRLAAEAFAVFMEGRHDIEPFAAVDAVLAGGGRAPRRAPRGLTDREVEVLVLLARGKSNREIGALLGISPRTAQNHVAHVYDKIGVYSRAGAALFAVENGLVGPGT